MKTFKNIIKKLTSPFNTNVKGKVENNQSEDEMEMNVVVCKNCEETGFLIRTVENGNIKMDCIFCGAKNEVPMLRK